MSRSPLEDLDQKRGALPFLRRVNHITTPAYGYDAAGNITAIPCETFTYNASEQMTSSKSNFTKVATSEFYAGAASVRGPAYVDLHCHLEGSLRVSPLIELTQRD